ncbi:MAG: DUF3298 and DUF4163 domain-containing protein [Lachnospiraceae bacterium]|nr:DUF3298 and DUF4163 domain-containing protein [Lachnospiraceae bacterium]
MHKQILAVIITLALIPSAMAAAARSHPDIRKESKREEIKSDQGEIILKVDYEYPQIINPMKDVGIENVNKELKAYAMERYESNMKDASQLTEEFLKNVNRSGNANRSSLLPFTMDLRYETTLDIPELVSFLWEESNYFGGAHPDTKWNGVVYDLRNGKKLEAGDILSIPEEQIKQYIAQAFQEKAKAETGMFFPEEVEKLSLLQFKYYFYLREEGMIFFLDPYQIAPYVAGRVEVILPYEKSEYYRPDIWETLKQNGRN